MPFEIIRNDLTKVQADAIVNASDSFLTGGGGVDGAIHVAAGHELLAECYTLGGCDVGQAKITKGYNLPADYVIHTVGPIWHGGQHNEEKLLAQCYKSSLALAKEYNLESIAFPLISSGTFGYPKDKALKTAIYVIGEFVLQNEMWVFLVVYDKDSFMISKKLFSSIHQYIDDKYIQEQSFDWNVPFKKRDITHESLQEDSMDFSVEESVREVQYRNLDEVVKQMDETFSQRLLRLIDQKGKTDVETYKKANIDRKLFSKIRNDIDYKPSKSTALAFAIALKLNLDETKDLLRKAGFALSDSRKFDIIIQYFIEQGNYNVFEINEALFAFDQKLLGL